MAAASAWLGPTPERRRLRFILRLFVLWGRAPGSASPRWAGSRAVLIISESAVEVVFFLSFFLDAVGEWQSNERAMARGPRFKASTTGRDMLSSRRSRTTRSTLRSRAWRRLRAKKIVML